MQTHKLLIVDDEALIRLNLKMYLEGKGYEIEEADSGEAGLSLLEEKTFALCLLDDGLPDTSAQQFIIQANKVKAGLPHLIYTGSLDYQLPSVLQDYGLDETSVLYKVKDGLEEIARRVDRLVYH